MNWLSAQMAEPARHEANNAVASKDSSGIFVAVTAALSRGFTNLPTVP